MLLSIWISVSLKCIFRYLSTTAKLDLIKLMISTISHLFFTKEGYL